MLCLEDLGKDRLGRRRDGEMIQRRGQTLACPLLVPVAKNQVHLHWSVFWARCPVARALIRSSEAPHSPCPRMGGESGQGHKSPTYSGGAWEQS